ncbi:hypothetical protein GJ496_002559 [Pomphorhynchus laevis]|nr:hypothetical protein GJ496_002559 [Pomphorhynchus laevis]
MISIARITALSNCLQKSSVLAGSTFLIRNAIRRAEAQWRNSRQPGDDADGNEKIESRTVSESMTIPCSAVGIEVIIPLPGKCKSVSLRCVCSEDGASRGEDIRFIALP